MPEKLISLYKQYTGSTPSLIEKLGASGSARQYFRLHGRPTLIGTLGTNTAENKAFIYLAGHFKQSGLNVPEVAAVSDDNLAYLQQDLGDRSLFDIIKQHEPNAATLLHATISQLPELQFRSSGSLNWDNCFPQPEFDSRTVLWDLNYFKYCFLKATGIEINETALEDDFQHMATELTGHNCCFMYRDFQSRNVMIHQGQPWFIDFQGGRRGPCHYDVASFLWQARAGFSDSTRNQLINTYIDAARKYIDIDPDTFRSTLDKFVLFRTLQVLGAYGFRGYFERKQHFIDSIPAAIANLKSLLAEGVANDYPYLKALLTQLVTEKEAKSGKTASSSLTVHVCSFSYKQGLPQDPSGNGGGFVFDCRAIHNPGRYEPYKNLTGLDRPVINFLEKDGEIIGFLDHCYALVDSSVECYIRRGFTDLSVAFGCTGGRHRSVYGAQHMAEHIHNKFNITVELEHREQGIKQIIGPK